MVKIRNILKLARRENHFLQQHVAEYLEMSTRSYRAIENGSRGTSETNWLKLYNLFDQKYPLNELMQNETVNPPVSA